MGLDAQETHKNVDFHEKTEALFSVLSDFIFLFDISYLRFNNKKEAGLCPPYAIKGEVYP